MKHLTAETIRTVCNGILQGMPFAGELTEIVTDSRKVTPGCLFAAIRGERADGHDYIASAFEKGAACCLAEFPPDTEAVGCLLLVPDTVAALQKIAGAYRKEFNKIPVIGVTGSVGKTTMKEMLSAVLSRRFRVHKTEGNFNNDLGVPLTLFGLREEHEAAVVELGVSHPGDMARIASIAAPTMAVYTNIGDAHLEYLGSREGVLREKSALNEFLPPEGAAVFCNGDDPLLADMPCRAGLRKVLYGLGEKCAVRATGTETLPDGTTACDITAGAQRFRAVIPAFGEHMVSAALGAAAVGLTLGLTAEEISAGITDYAPVGRRARFYRAGKLTLIDDSYNANPTSTAAALRSLSRLEGRKVAVLGDMLELGGASEALHRETGTLARECGIGLVLTTGDAARCIAEGAGREIARHFAEKPELIRALPALLAPGDTVLVKASRGARFEEITAALETLFP